MSNEATKKVINPDEKEPSIPFSVGPTSGPLKPADIIEDDEKTVDMFFPKDVHIMTDNNVQVKFPAGVQKVPKHLVDHVALKRAGVEKHTPKKSTAADTDHAAKLAEKK